MRKMKRLFTIAVMVFFVQQVSATTHTIFVGQGGLLFSPSSITTVVVGDVIHWSWVSGSHTSTSVSIPGGAASWTVGMSSSANDFDYNVTTVGTYNYQCNPHSGSGMTGSFVVSAATTAIDPSSIVYGSLVLSPNPATDNMQLKFNSDHSFNATFLVFDAMGNEKMKKRIDVQSGDNNYTLNVSNLAKGVYILNVLDGNAALVARRFIKE